MILSISKWICISFFVAIPYLSFSQDSSVVNENVYVELIEETRSLEKERNKRLEDLLNLKAEVSDKKKHLQSISDTIQFANTLEIKFKQLKQEIKDLTSQTEKYTNVQDDLSLVEDSLKNQLQKIVELKERIYSERIIQDSLENQISFFSAENERLLKAQEETKTRIGELEQDIKNLEKTQTETLDSLFAIAKNSILLKQFDKAGSNLVGIEGILSNPFYKNKLKDFRREYDALKRVFTELRLADKALHEPYDSTKVYYRLSKLFDLKPLSLVKSDSALKALLNEFQQTLSNYCHETQNCYVEMDYYILFENPLDENYIKSLKGRYPYLFNIIDNLNRSKNKVSINPLPIPEKCKNE